jgi:predicted O-linked N-acetylglucosamine transferase (SPINDLY family)
MRTAHPKEPTAEDFSAGSLTGAPVPRHRAHPGFGRSEKAITAFERSIDAQPKSISAYKHLLGCLIKTRRWSEAGELCRKAAAIAPMDPTFHAAMGDLHLRARSPAKAAECFRKAVRLQPGKARTLVGLAVALNRLGKWPEAAEAALSALRLDAKNPAAHGQVAAAMMALGRTSNAASEIERILELSPGHVESLVLLANIELERMNHSSAVALLRQAFDRSSGSELIHSKVLHARNYAPDEDEAALFAEHVDWANRVLSKAAPLPRVEASEPDRPLRIGYVSPDFREHPVAHFLEPILEQHTGGQCAAVLFSDVRHPDQRTRRLQHLATEWHDSFNLNERQLAELVRSQRIDILVDLAGHTMFNRLPMFALRPAPVQVTYLGYPNTTGLPANIMHFRVTDETCDPSGVADSMHTERLVRLPRCFLCYKPPVDTPEPAAPPAESNSFVTFGCFNQSAKLSGWLLDLWAAVLRSVPRSRLLLKNSILGDEPVREQIHKRFAAANVAPERVMLFPRDSSAREHLARYGQVDIALDTYPYHGTTTTCEALWMGVPVITIAGSPHRSRVGVSILGSVGLEDLVATTPGQYVRKAVELAADLTRLKALRAELRPRMRQSRLMDATGFVHDLEAAYRQMWRQACLGKLGASGQA